MVGAWTNITITVPNGSTQHGNLLCTPAHWTDIIVFYLSNYVVHVASVQLYPGESGTASLLPLISALLFPTTSGIRRGLNAIVRHAVTEKDPLSSAARAGALCMVVRSADWKAAPGDRLRNVFLRFPRFERSSLPKLARSADGQRTDDQAVLDGRTRARILSDIKSIDCSRLAHQTDDSTTLTPASDLHSASHEVQYSVIEHATLFEAPWQLEGSSVWRYNDISTPSVLGTGRKIAGNATLPDGYAFAFVPRDAMVEPFERPNDKREPPAKDTQAPKSPQSAAVKRKLVFEGDTITASYSLVNAVAAVAQLVFGLSTLYGAASPQIDRYGYTAFGLTVVPYAIMSLVNLIASMVTPNYADVYLVDSEIMQEAKARGGEFSGMVGCLLSDDRPAFLLKDPALFREINGTISWEYPAVYIDNTRARRSLEDVPGPKRSAPFFLPLQDPTDKAKGATGLLANFEIIHQGFEISSQSQLGSQQYSLLAPRVSDRPREYLYVPKHPQFQRSQRWYNWHELDIDNDTTSRTQRAETVVLLACLLLGLASLLPIGVLSHFRKGQSTLSERVILMTWLAIGVWWGVIAGYVPEVLPLIWNGFESSFSAPMCNSDLECGPAVKAVYDFTVLLTERRDKAVRFFKIFTGAYL